MRRAGAVLPLPGLRPRALLALLAVNANRAISTERLIDELWSGAAPPRARSALQVHIATLRRALGAGHNLATVAGGYVLRLSPERVDAAVFEQAVESVQCVVRPCAGACGTRERVYHRARG